jgi:hypothetical protein
MSIHTRATIFNAIAAFSLLLLLAVMVMWLDSGWNHAALQWNGKQSGMGIISMNTQMLIYRMELGPESSFPTQGLDASHWPNDDDQFLSQSDFVEYYLWGFGFGIDFPAHNNTTSALLVPHWFLSIILSIFPTIWQIKWQQRRKLGSNACRYCGYDLTGNKQGSCPECGMEERRGI